MGKETENEVLLYVPHCKWSDRWSGGKLANGKISPGEKILQMASRIIKHTNINEAKTEKDRGSYMWTLLLGNVDFKVIKCLFVNLFRMGIAWCSDVIFVTPKKGNVSMWNAKRKSNENDSNSSQFLFHNFKKFLMKKKIGWHFLLLL